MSRRRIPPQHRIWLVLVGLCAVAAGGVALSTLPLFSEHVAGAARIRVSGHIVTKVEKIHLPARIVVKDGKKVRVPGRTITHVTTSFQPGTTVGIPIVHTVTGPGGTVTIDRTQTSTVPGPVTTIVRTITGTTTVETTLPGSTITNTVTTTQTQTQVVTQTDTVTSTEIIPTTVTVTVTSGPPPT